VTGNDKIVLLLGLIYVTTLRIIKYGYWGAGKGVGRWRGGLENIPQQMMLRKKCMCTYNSVKGIV
jgi:hypothetical protein